jgi:hypothetical protein
MVAEYHLVEKNYHYYTSDQINSIREVTDHLGNVVYAVGHDLGWRQPGSTADILGRG